MRLPYTEGEGEGPNLTPIIDVVFLLLIFFLVATRFDQEERDISTKLAEVLQAQPMAMGGHEVIVNIGADGKYKVVDQTYNEDLLAGLIHEMAIKNPGNVTVRIRSDENAKFRYPAYLMGICERENVKHYCTVLQKR